MPRNPCKISAKCLRGTEPKINCGHKFVIGGPLVRQSCSVMSTKTGRKRLSLSEALIDNQFDNVALEQGNWVPRHNKNSSKKNCAPENKERTY